MGNFVNQAELSLTHIPTGQKVGIKVSDGQLEPLVGTTDNHDFIPTGFGGSAMIFAGIGAITGPVPVSPVSQGRRLPGALREFFTKRRCP